MSVPSVVITMRSGRSDDQVRALIEEVTAAVVRTVDASPDRVRVLVHELDSSRIGVGGVLSSDRHDGAARAGTR
jgi:4-oxalocrotonate tautomerase